jgi:type I restriction enzyme, S subunit
MPDQTWQTVRFGDMVQNINERILPEDVEGLPYVGLEHLDPESLKIRRWGTPDEVEAQKLRFYTGDIIFGKRRYYQKKLAVADFEGICSAHAMVLRAKPDVVLPDFLPFFMQSEMFFERAMSVSVGSLSPTINWSALARQEFAVPPLEEQHRIAEILWAVEDTIVSYENVKEHHLVVNDLVVSHLLDYGLDEEGRLRDPLRMPREFAPSQLALLHCNWELVSIESKFSLKTGATPLRAKGNEYFNPNGTPWVKTLDLNEGWIYETEEKITQKALIETNCMILPENTVLVAMYGGWNQIGRTGILAHPAATNQALCAILPNGETEMLFILYALQVGRLRWKRVAASSRKDPNITKKDVGQFLVKLPRNRDEQVQICNVVLKLADEMEALINHIQFLTKLKLQLLRNLI